MAAVPSIGRATAVEPRPVDSEAQATSLLYERYSRQIFNFCLHRLGSREEAEDAAQTTFLNAFRGMQRGVRPELEQAWLFKIAENVCLTRHRSTFRRRRVESPSDLDVLQEVVPSPQRDAETLIRLSDALSEMSDQQRKALLLREWQGLSYREIADELGLSQPAVETLLFRARRSLASGLTEAPQKKRRARLRAGLDIGAVLAAAKGAFAGGAAVKVAAVAAVATTTAVAGNEVKKVERSHVQKAHAPAVRVTKAPARAAVSRTVSASVAPAAAPKRKPAAKHRVAKVNVRHLSPLAARRATALRLRRLDEHASAPPETPVAPAAPVAPAPAEPVVEAATPPPAPPAVEHTVEHTAPTPPAPEPADVRVEDGHKSGHRQDRKSERISRYDAKRAERDLSSWPTAPAQPSAPVQPQAPAQSPLPAVPDPASATAIPGPVTAPAAPAPPVTTQNAPVQPTPTSAPVTKVNDGGGKRDGKWKNPLPAPDQTTPAATPPDAGQGTVRERDRGPGRRK